MKLIIDIDEETYEVCKAWEKTATVFSEETKAIANGIPYEPQGDSISRSALKKAFESWKNLDDYYHDTDCNDIPFSEAYDLIDNAPTVDVEDFKKFVESRLDMQDLYLPIHFFDLLDEYCGGKREADNE